MVFAPNADLVFADGPSSQPYQPTKSEIRKLFKQYEQAIEAYSSGAGSIAKQTLAQLNADLAKAADTTAWVYGDADVGNNGIYRKTGAPGSGSWVRILPLPYSFIIASDVGAGTANDIQASTSIPLSNAALVWMQVEETNTGSPVTVSFNGGPGLTIKTNTGNDIAPGGLEAGMTILGVVAGATFRLLNDQVSSTIVAAAEAAQAAAEDAAASINIRNFSARAGLKALNTSSASMAFLGEAGREGVFRWIAGDYSAHIAADTLEGIYLKADGVSASAGAWIRQDGWHVSGINPEWFGARSGNAATSFTYDSGDAINAALSLAATVGASVTLPSGFYLSGKRLNVPSGVIFDGTGTNEAWEIPFFDLASATIQRGVTICFIGTGARDLTLDFCSAMRHSGASRLNISRPYNTALDQYLEATDFTNGDAVGVTRATLRAFSAAVLLGGDGLSGKSILRNIRFVPACADASSHLGGYLSANAGAYVPWSEWDVGILDLNPYTSVVEDCQFAGYWHRKGAVQSSIRFGNTTAGGRGEMGLWERNWFQGGIAVRNGDFYPILSKTATTVTIAWSPGHRFLLTGSIFIDSTSYAYTGLTYSATGEGTLTFTGIASTTNVEVSGNDRSIVHMTNNNGTTQTAFRDNNIRDFWHTSLVERPSGAFGAQAGKYSAAIELVGYPIRGLLFENNTIYTQEPMFLLQVGARDNMWIKGTYEEKAYRTALGGATNPSGLFQGLALVGPSDAWVDQWPMLQRGDNTLVGYSWSGRLNIAPRVLASAGRRYSAMADCYNGFRLEWKGRGSGDNDIIWDARLPERYIINGGSITVYTRHFQIDTEGSAAMDDLTNAVPGHQGLSDLIFQTFSSSRDVVIKHMAAGDYNFYCKSGADTTLFSPITPVMFVLLGKTWYQI